MPNKEGTETHESVDFRFQFTGYIDMPNKEGTETLETDRSVPRHAQRYIDMPNKEGTETHESVDFRFQFTGYIDMPNKEGTETKSMIIFPDAS